MTNACWKFALFHVPVGAIFFVLFLCGSISTDAQTDAGANGANEKIPRGTILPVVLRSAISFDKTKAGQVVHGEIAQDVPLGNGATIQKGSKVEGHILEVTATPIGSGKAFKVQFDKVNVDGHWTNVATSLRAIAGFMTVIDAGIPVEAPTEGSPYNWLPKEQIGGDTDYGVGGPVLSADGSKVVGKFVSGGMLGQVSAKEGSRCRGPIDSNNTPQALWVFSSDACGVYGIQHLQIEHAGRTDPVGTIVLASDTKNLKLRDGDGLLLRVN